MAAVDFGVTEMLLAEQIAAREGFSAEWAPEELPRFPVVFGLWKGDLTLKRAIVDGLAQIEKERRDGEDHGALSRRAGRQQQGLSFSSAK